MITSVQFTEAGAAKFNKWFADVAREGVRVEVVAMEVCDMAAERLDSNEALIYELGRQYTANGVPALVKMEEADFDVEREADE